MTSLMSCSHDNVDEAGLKTANALVYLKTNLVMAPPSADQAWDSFRQGFERLYQRPETVNRTILFSLHTLVLFNPVQ